MLDIGERRLSFSGMFGKSALDPSKPMPEGTSNVEELKYLIPIIGKVAARTTTTYDECIKLYKDNPKSSEYYKEALKLFLQRAQPSENYAKLRTKLVSTGLDELLKVVEEHREKINSSQNVSVAESNKSLINSSSFNVSVAESDESLTNTRFKELNIYSFPHRLIELCKQPTNQSMLEARAQKDGKVADAPSENLNGLEITQLTGRQR